MIELEPITQNRTRMDRIRSTKDPFKQRGLISRYVVAESAAQKVRLSIEEQVKAIAAIEMIAAGKEGGNK